MRRALAISAVFVPFVLAALAACVGDDATAAPPGVDSGGGDDGGGTPPPPPGTTPPPSPVDGGSDAPPSKPCSAGDAFTFAGPIPELNGSAMGAIDVDARLSPDQLTVYWSTNRGGGSANQIWTATRSSVSVQFGSLVQVAIPSSASLTGPVGAPYPGTLFFGTYALVGEAVYSISYSTLSGATWSTPTTVDNAKVGPLGSPYGEPYVSRDLLTLVYEGPGAGGSTIYELDRATAGDVFDNRKELTELSSADSQGAPVLSQDKLVVYFSTNRAHADAGNPNYYEIWYAKRNTTADPFGTPLPVQGSNINDQNDTKTAPTWISDDQCTLYFTSNRFVSGSNNKRVFKATRPPPM